MVEVVVAAAPVSKFQEKVVARFQKLFLSMFQGNNVKQFRDKFLNRIVSKYQDRAVKQSQDKTAKVFQFRFLYSKEEGSKEQFVKLLIHVVIQTVTMEIVEVVYLEVC